MSAFYQDYNKNAGHLLAGSVSSVAGTVMDTNHCPNGDHSDLLPDG